MSGYKVRHQCDKTCADCEFYEFEIVEDSFGHMREEYCSKNHYEYVGIHSEPCEDYKEA